MSVQLSVAVAMEKILAWGANYYSSFLIIYLIIIIITVVIAAIENNAK